VQENKRARKRKRFYQKPIKEMAEFADDGSTIMRGTAADKASDFANYFCSYAELYHQKQMLMDHNRMRAYHDSIMLNKDMFKDKVVLDVGTGSGVLAIWAAKAGAKRVFAVEFTDMAKHARALVEANDVSGIVEVIQSSAEDLELDCKVDIIISEWMGYFLLRESMVDSLIRARNKFLAPGGTLFPSHATMLWGTISFEDDRQVKKDDYMHSMNDWQSFLGDMKRLYDVDMAVLNPHFEKEQSDYFIYSSLWTELNPRHLVGQPVVVGKLDLNTCTIAQASCISQVPYAIPIPYGCTISGFAGWFTVDFAGSAGSPIKQRVVLSTGPEGGYTHWGQQVFYLPDAIEAGPDTLIHGDFEMRRQEKNKRLYNVHLSVKVDDESEPRVVAVWEMP
jgi:type I protein arginine methyltransferase